jgi:hypothetical protein
LIGCLQPQISVLEEKVTKAKAVENCDADVVGTLEADLAQKRKELELTVRNTLPEIAEDAEPVVAEAAANGEVPQDQDSNPAQSANFSVRRPAPTIDLCRLFTQIPILRRTSVS